MFCSFVCLVFLIWCQLLNYSAATNDETLADNVLTLRNGTLLTVRSNGPNSHSPGADWDTGIEGAISTGEDAASGYQFLQKKLLDELKDYKFVFPHVLAGRKKRSVAILPQKSYPNLISISVELEGKQLTLDLGRNTLLLPRGFQVSYYDSNGTLVTEKETEMYRCCYEGSVRELPGSQVSASICSGLSALIVFSNRSYIIEHLAGDKHGRHLLYRPEDLPPGPSSCGVKNTSPEFTLTDHLLRSRRIKGNVLGEMRYVELVLVVASDVYRNLGSRRSAVVKRMVDIANTVDMYYRPFKIRISLIGVEIWTTDQIKVVRSSSTTLARFFQWRKDILLPRIYNDNSHLISGGTYDNGIIGLATLAAMCLDTSSGGINLDNRPSHLAVSVTVAHEMGHNLGMSHDTGRSHCDCPNKAAGCIMEESTGAVLPTGFSLCSRDDLVLHLKRGLGVCLYNLPNFDKLVGGIECGNLYVERGEECDCGKPAECTDTCCEAATCKLKAAAKCSTGACCKDCQFIPRGVMCRPLSGECDLPETCTGILSTCPVNTHLKDGYTCNDGRLFCSRGVCQSVDQQCKDIWGNSASNAAEICYETMNTFGDEFGHCGKDQDGNYIKCKSVNVFCGKMQCQGGTKYPQRGGIVRILKSSFTVGPVTYHCRGISSVISDAGTPDLIHHGSKCGRSKQLQELCGRFLLILSMLL
ncbi:disintegrin and metalloproteinase domain-containing protein 12-like [Mustelus asterias]